MHAQHLTVHMNPLVMLAALPICVVKLHAFQSYIQWGVHIPLAQLLHPLLHNACLTSLKTMLLICPVWQLALITCTFTFFCTLNYL